MHALFEALPPTSIVLDDYARFLYHIGERSLPDAFVRIADALRRGDAAKMLEKSNTVFILEALLRGYVYGRPLELKRDPAFATLSSSSSTASSRTDRPRPFECGTTS